jgi:hypothetical protein
MRFFERYKQRSSVIVSRPSIFSNPLLSSHKALHDVYGSRFSIFLNPRKWRYNLSFNSGFSYPLFSMQDNLISSGYITYKAVYIHSARYPFREF